jgi:N-methylhydantoinase B
VSAERLDPILLEVLWNRLVSVVEEQARALMRTSFTSVVREAGDLSAGLFDRRGRMVAQAVTGTPGHVNAMATSAHHFLEAFPVETLRPGDALVTNHPWQTSGHLNDFTVMTPIFRGGELVAFFGNCCHALDLGGRGFGASLPGASPTRSCCASSGRTCGRPSRSSATSTPRPGATRSAGRA